MFGDGNGGCATDCIQFSFSIKKRDISEADLQPSPSLDLGCYHLSGSSVLPKDLGTVPAHCRRTSSSSCYRRETESINISDGCDDEIEIPKLCSTALSYGAKDCSAKPEGA